MNDRDKSKDQLIAELVELRQRSADKSELPELRRAAALLRVAPLGVYECNTEGRITAVNPSHEAITGYTAGELVGTYIWDRMVPGPEKDSLRAYFKHVVAEQPAPQPYFAKKIKKSGELVDVRFDWNYIRNAQGELTGFVSIVTDVTAERSAQAALQRSEEQYRSLAETTADVIYILDREGKLLYVNRTAAAFFRVSPADLVGKTQQDLFPPEQVTSHLECIRNVFETGEMQEEESLYRFGPQEVWLNVRTIPLRDEQGQITSLMGICRNVTQQKRAELALRESEERFRRIFDEGPLGIALLNPDLSIERMNRRMCDLLGYSEREIIDLGLAAISRADDYRIDAQLAASLLRGEIPSYTMRKCYLRKDGRQIWGQLTVSLIRNVQGQPIHLIGMVQDITEQQRAEAALRASEVKYRRLHQSMMDAFVRTDVSGRIQEFNDAYRQMVGYGPEELIELHYADITPEQWHGIEARIVQEQILRQGCSSTYEKEYRRKDGTVFPVELRTFLLTDDDGQPESMWAIVRDITDRKRAEQELQQAHNVLEQRVKERTVELTESNKRLLAEVEQRRRTEQELAIFRRFAEASGQGLGMADLQGNIAYVNPTLLRWAGENTPQDCIGKPLSAYIPADYRERREKEILPAMLRDGYWQGEQTLTLRDGKTVATIFTVFSVLDERGNLIRTAVAITDITELKRAEERLAMLGRFVEAATQGFGMADIDGRILYVNPFLARLFGAENLEDVIGKPVSAYYPPDYPPRREQEIIPALRRGEHWQGEQMMVFPDGQLHPTLHTVFPVCNDRGDLLRTAAVITDITALKQEQQALRRMVLAGDHERRLITYELHDGVAQQLMGAMIYLQSQELPTAAKSKEAETAFREGMAALRRASSEVRRVMNRLRTPVLDKFGLAEAIEDVAAQLRLMPGAPEIECRHDVKFKRLEPALENSLFRIAQEVMTNACRHSKSKKVQVKLAQKGGDATLEIRDWGIGFDQKKVEENRFGLEGIRERARILGGKLSIKSKPGEGTVVRVKFPVVEVTEEK